MSMKWIYWLFGAGTLYLAATLMDQYSNAAITLALIAIFWFLTALRTK